jgi:hypothetical protein
MSNVSKTLGLGFSVQNLICLNTYFLPFSRKYRVLKIFFGMKMSLWISPSGILLRFENETARNVFTGEITSLSQGSVQINLLETQFNPILLQLEDGFVILQMADFGWIERHLQVGLGNILQVISYGPKTPATLTLDWYGERIGQPFEFRPPQISVYLQWPSYLYRGTHGEFYNSTSGERALHVTNPQLIATLPVDLEHVTWAVETSNEDVGIFTFNAFGDLVRTEIIQGDPVNNVVIRYSLLKMPTSLVPLGETLPMIYIVSLVSEHILARIDDVMSIVEYFRPERESIYILNDIPYFRRTRISLMNMQTRELVPIRPTDSPQMVLSFIPRNTRHVTVFIGDGRVFLLGIDPLGNVKDIDNERYVSRPFRSFTLTGEPNPITEELSVHGLSRILDMHLNSTETQLILDEEPPSISFQQTLVQLISNLYNLPRPEPSQLGEYTRTTFEDFLHLRPEITHFEFPPSLQIFGGRNKILTYETYSGKFFVEVSSGSWSNLINPPQ